MTKMNDESELFAELNTKFSKKAKTRSKDFIRNLCQSAKWVQMLILGPEIDDCLETASSYRLKKRRKDEPWTQTERNRVDFA